MSARARSSVHPLARFGLLVAVVIAGALLLSLTGHHDDASAGHPVAAQTVSDIGAASDVGAAPALAVPVESEELLACSLVVLCCIAVLALVRALRRGPALGDTVTGRWRGPRLDLAVPRVPPAPSLETLSISRT